VLRAITAAVLAVLLLAPAPSQAREWQLEAAMTGRYAFLPSSFLDSFFEVHGRIHGFGPGLMLGWTRDGFHANAVADLVVVNTPPQVWLEKGAENRDAIWIEEDLRLLSYGLVFAYEWPIAGPVSFMPGIGFVPLNIEGNLLEYPTDGEIGTPVEERTKADGPDGKPVRLPQQFKGADLSLALRVQPGHSWFVTADFGWRMVLYTGLTAGWAF
jgi:hypothetical protein